MIWEKPEKRLELLYRCRDFELSHLWQRSVFLGAFLLLCFSGYAYFIGSDVEKIQKYLCGPFSSSLYRENTAALLWNFITLIICITGFTLSIIWILMGKASKMWYEIYEKYICNFEAGNHNVPHLSRMALRNSYFTDPRYRMGAITEIEEDKVNNSIFSCKAGCYSPSKINIMLGHISMCIWSFLGLIHLVCILSIYFNAKFSNIAQSYAALISQQCTTSVSTQVFDSLTVVFSLIDASGKFPLFRLNIIVLLLIIPFIIVHLLKKYTYSSTLNKKKTGKDKQ